MARIQTFTAPRTRLDPSDRPQAAWETAGRRVGPLFNEVGQTLREVARAEGATLKGRIWPYDIAALNAASERAVAAGAGAGGGGIGSKIRGSFGNQWGSAGSNPEGDSPGRRSGRLGEVAAGAAGMSRVAKEMVTPKRYDIDASGYSKDQPGMIRNSAGWPRMANEDPNASRATGIMYDDAGMPIYMGPNGPADFPAEYGQPSGEGWAFTDEQKRLHTSADWNNFENFGGNTDDGSPAPAQSSGGVWGAISGMASAIGSVFSSGAASAGSADYAPPAVEFTAPIPSMDDQ